MNLSVTVILAQLAVAPHAIAPTLSFPEAGLDLPAAYEGYQTRFFRDAAGNTVQVYINSREGRVVHLLADSENGSIGFSIRDAMAQPASVRWASDSAIVASRAGRRTLEYRLVADAPRVRLGWFLLGSMRVERDFQYWRKHRAPFTDPRFVLEEYQHLFAALGHLPAAERERHLALLNARSLDALRRRVHPVITTRAAGPLWTARALQPSLDLRDTLSVEIVVDTRRVAVAQAGDSVSLRARAGTTVPFTVRIAMTTEPLAPLERREIFTGEFLDFVARARSAAAVAPTDSTAIRARWLERQVRGVELLSSRDKLMAGLPAYATYFGRDMLLSALMMRPIWRDEMSEFAIASVLRKLSPRGEVSHEEALGEQATREAAAEYARLIEEWRTTPAVRVRDADSLLARARAVLRDHRRVRENYHMIDDEFQLPVLVARWLADADVTAERKRAFLLDSTDGGGTRLARLLRELALVARLSSTYVANPIATNLVAFPARDSTRWAAASWRDSGVGYANGRFAMDINAIWVPHALQSIADIFAALRGIGLSPDSLARVLPELASDTPLGRYARDPQALRSATAIWWDASRHFVLRFSAAELRARVGARLAALPAGERAYWTTLLARSTADDDSVSFLALALDAAGQPIGVMNTDPATAMFLGDAPDAGPAETMRDVRTFVRDYPVGLFIDRVGPAVANDAYATPAIWRAFEEDQYHGPRVVWGREVNLFLMGALDRLRDPRYTAHAAELRSAIRQIRDAVQASGFRSELWSYEVRPQGVVPVRYGTGSDVQLWSTTDLAVQFALDRAR